MSWEQILVLILGAALAVFLVLAIVLVVLLIKVSRQLKRIADTAQRTVGSVETTVSNLSRATSPVYVTKFITSYLKRMKSK